MTMIDVTPTRRAAYLDTRRPILFGFATLAGFAAVFGLWSALAPLSSAAIAEGSLDVESQRQSVQHPYGGVVQELRVKEGDVVQKGDVLIVLSDAAPRAQRDILISQRDALLAEEARLFAERDHKSEPDFVVLGERALVPAVGQAMANQRAVMAARARERDAQLKILNQKVAQLAERKVGLQSQVDGLTRQRDLLEEEAKGARELLAKGFTPKNRVLGLDRDAAKLDADRGARLADIATVEQQSGEAQLEISKLDRTFTSEVTDRLRAVQDELVTLAPKIVAASDVLARTRLTAPVGGSVVGLSVFTEGGVIQPGANILDIVPTANPLVVNARLPVSDVSDVAVGRSADIRLNSINRNERPTIRGTVMVVSADRLSDSRSGQPYYAIKASMNPDDVARAHTALQAGMTAEVVVPTRGRTLAEYLIGPLLDEISGAFREK